MKQKKKSGEPTYRTKYFPFSPGVPWKCRNGYYIEPKIDAETWNSVLADKDAVILAYGGFLEAFYSLMVAEVLNRQKPSRRLFWGGNHMFKPLPMIQGLAHPIDSIVSAEKAKKYPVPLFLDKENIAYFNCLNNYITKTTYLQTSPRIRKDPVIKHIFDNSMVDWDQYLPKLRYLNNYRKPFVEWMKLSKFYPNKPYIVIFPDKTGLSDHEEDLLGWSNQEVRELAAILNQLGYSLVICSNHTEKYTNCRAYVAPTDIFIILYLLESTRGILSREIDMLLVSLALNDAALISKRSKLKHFDLYKNAEFLDAENVIFTGEYISPKDVFLFLEGICE